MNSNALVLSEKKSRIDWIKKEKKKQMVLFGCSGNETYNYVEYHQKSMEKNKNEEEKQQQQPEQKRK